MIAIVIRQKKQVLEKSAKRLSRTEGPGPARDLPATYNLQLASRKKRGAG
jgi:hypothetical protein